MKMRWTRVRLAIWVGLVLWVLLYVPPKLEERYGWELGALAEGRAVVSTMFGLLGEIRDWIYCGDDPPVIVEEGTAKG